MALGQRSLYQSLFAEMQLAPVVDVLTRKGRSELLKQKQNELIICRYYYHIKIIGRQYESTLELLEQQEVFLSQRTLVDIISNNQPLLRNLHNTRPDVKYFRHKYPHFVWCN